MQAEKKLIIYGDSGFAQMIGHYFESDSDYRVVAYCADRAYRSREEIDGIPVFDLEEIQSHCTPKDHEIFAAIGYKSVRTHRDLFKKIIGLGYPVASYISTQAMVDSSCQIGRNVLILPGVILEPEVTIGDNCFVNSGATVCHHTKIGAHSILAAGSLVGGHTRVGEVSLIGFHATVAELIDVAEETLIGAGSVLLEDTQPYTMYAGSPAKAVRTHKETGIMIIPKKLQERG